MSTYDPLLEVLRRLWREANKPDANLGDASIGPSPQKVTLASARRLIEALEVDGDSSFYDIGCGQGLVCFAARVLGGCPVAGGIELREAACSWAKDRALEKEFLWSHFACGDLMALPALGDEWDTVYCFDKDFPPKVLDHLCRWARAQRVWRLWASAHRWSDELMRDTGARLERTVQVELCGSGERHAIYVYKRRGGSA